MMRVLRPVSPAIPAGCVLAEYDARHPRHIAQDEVQLPPEERAIAETIRSAPRRTGFIAGRLALHAALGESDARAHSSRPILRDARGRPSPTWDAPPPLSIAHSRKRAIAMVAPSGSCAAIGVDVEEVDAHRAHALVRMSLSDAEIALIRATDAELLQGPIALWCARESCVKAHALEVGWFGTSLVATCFEPCESPIENAIRAWRIEIAFESSPTFIATAWATDEAVYACAARV